MTAHSEELGNVISSLVLCMFTAYALTGEIMSKMIKSVDGADISTEELRRAGERIWLLQRSFNVLCGFTAADDTLPARVLHPHIEGQVSGLDKVVYQITSTQLPSNLNVRRKILKTYDFILPRQAKLVRFMGKLMFFKKLRAKEQVVKGSPELDAMKRDYYTLRGLDPRGVPTKQKLAETGLEHAAKLIYN